MLRNPLRSPLRPLLRAMRAGNSTPSVPSFYFNFSNPQNVTLGAAQARGNITSTQNAVIAARVSPSRTTGVAPLYVNFDATATTSTLSTNPSHELFYATDFGDYSAGTWANGVQSSGLTSKNAGYGPVTGHVYETPGTYTVQIVVTDGVNTATKTGTIVVQDPNTVYAGTNTICISNTNNTVGIPSGCTFVNRPGDTDMTAAINAVIGTYGANNKRILLCKADTWTATDQLTFNNITGMTIGGYGTGAAATFGSGTMVSVTTNEFGGATGKSLFLVNSGNSDLRICNFKIASNSTVHCAAVNSTMSGMLFYKVEIRGCAQGFNINASQNPTACVPDQACLYECLVDELAGMPFYDTPGVTATYDATTDTFTSVAHGYAINAQVKLRGNAVQVIPQPMLSASGNMGAIFNVIASGYTADTFKLSATVGGAAIDLTTSGTCTVALPELHGGICAYPALTRGGVMGCYFDACNHGEQVLRIPFADRAHVNNNYIARPNQQKNAFRIHSVIHAYFPVWSEKFVVSANVITSEGGYDYNGTTVNMGYGALAHMGSAGNAAVGGEWVRNGIFENNFLKSSLGLPKDGLCAVNLGAPNMTIRNNIADFSMGDRVSAFGNTATYAYTTMAFVDINTSTADQAVGIRVYNNTIYSNMKSAFLAVIATVTAPTGGNPQPDTLLVKNNILYLPQHVSAFYRQSLYQYVGAAATNVTTTNNTDEMGGGVTIATSPNFAAFPPVALADWRPTSGYATTGGATVPVLRDFNNASRYGSTYDLGAILP